MFECRGASDGAVVDRLRAAEQQIAALHGEQLHLIAELYRRAPDWITAAVDTPGLIDAADVAAAEIGVALRISRRSAMDRLGLALQLTRRLPDTAAVLRRGELSLAKARILAEATDDLTDEHTAQVEARVLPRAGGQTPSGLGASVARAVLAADPDAARRRHTEAVRERTVRFTPGVDGMASLWARLSAEDALGCYRELCELADTAIPPDPAASDSAACAGDPTASDPAVAVDDRTADARRADTLVDLIMGAALAQHATHEDDHPDAPPDSRHADNTAETCTSTTAPLPSAAGTPDAAASTTAPSPSGAGTPDTADPSPEPADPPSDSAGPSSDAGGTAASAGPSAKTTDTAALPSDAAGSAKASAGAGAVSAAVGVVPAALRRQPPSGTQPARSRARIDVTVAWTTLAGLDNEPGYLGGYGPIDADVARELAADATWRRLLTDPATGTVLDVGTTRYTPPTAMAALVRARDRLCRWYGCRQPATRCDLDHTVPHPDGPTATCNLACLCRGHHRLKTHTRWRVRQGRDGVLTWTSPTGQHVTTEPWPRDLHPPPHTPRAARQRGSPETEPPDIRPP